MQGSDEPKLIQVASRAAEIEGVTSHIRSASRQTGVSFDYLMAQAAKESNLSNEAKSHESSAAGLFQFTKGTWLQQVKLHGAKYGLGAFADMIEKHGTEYTIKDPEQRAHVLSLRKDPALSSMIAAEYAKDNRHWLEKSLGRKVGSTELYLAHFLGPAGAVKLLKAKADTPDASAADLVPQAAAKNQTMFYGQDHSAQSVTALYDRVKLVMENPLIRPSARRRRPSWPWPPCAMATCPGPTRPPTAPLPTLCSPPCASPCRPIPTAGRAPIASPPPCRTPSQTNKARKPAPPIESDNII